MDAQELALNFHNHLDIKANVTFFNGPFKQENYLKKINNKSNDNSASSDGSETPL